MGNKNDLKRPSRPWSLRVNSKSQRSGECSERNRFPLLLLSFIYHTGNVFSCQTRTGVSASSGHLITVLHWHSRSQHGLVSRDTNISLSFELLSLHPVLRQQQFNGRAWNCRTLHTGHVDAPWECLGHREFVMRDSRERTARVRLRSPLLLTPAVFVLICAVLPAARHHVPLEWLIIILQTQHEARNLVKTKKIIITIIASWIL